LPSELFKTYTSTYRLSEYDALQITDSKEVALYFNELVKHTSNYKSAANWIMGPVKAYINERALSFQDFKLPAEAIASLIALVDEGKVSHAAASQSIFPVLVENPDKPAGEIATEMDLLQNSDSGELQKLVDEVLAGMPGKVAEYRGGKHGLLGLFVGQVMKMSKGKADPKLLNTLVKETLEK
jgi:aspartyl-tRNA(Asn)/glutamyl-tRNA(Gln) amidotransferase subunit B